MTAIQVIGYIGGLIFMLEGPSPRCSTSCLSASFPALFADVTLAKETFDWSTAPALPAR